MKRLLLFSTLVSLLLITWLIAGVFNGEHCINSRFVKKIVYGEEQLRQCGWDALVQRGLWQSALSPKVKSMGQEVVAVEASLSFLPTSVSQLEIDAENDAEIGLVASKIISEGLSQNNPQVLSEPFLNDIFIGFLKIRFEKNYSSSMQSKISNLRYGAMFWPNPLMNTENYCQSRLRSLRHSNYCNSIARKGKADVNIKQLSFAKEKINLWSLNEFLAWGLYTYFSRAPVLTQWKILENLSTEKFSDIVDAIKMPLPTKTDPDYLKLWSYNYLMGLVQSVSGRNFSNKIFKQTVAQLGLDGSVDSGLIRVLVESESVFKEISKSWSDLALVGSGVEAKTLQLEFDNKFILWPKLTGVTQTQLVVGQSRDIILLKCDVPNIKNILRHQGSATRMIYVKYCGDDDKIKWQDLMVQGVSEFLKNNSNMKYMLFHIPSLAMANEKKGFSQLDLVAYTNQRLSKKTFVWDDGARAYRSLLPIEPVSLFR